ncbi:MAG: hypothetical protein R3A79_17150 [Nannocystaceae bacterium]
MPTDDKKEILRRKADLSQSPLKRREGIGGRTSITTSAGRKDYREKLVAEKQALEKELIAAKVDLTQSPLRRREGIGGRASITTSAGRKDYREKLLVDSEALDAELEAQKIPPIGK